MTIDRAPGKEGHGGAQVTARSHWPFKTWSARSDAAANKATHVPVNQRLFLLDLRCASDVDGSNLRPAGKNLSTPFAFAVADRSKPQGAGLGSELA
jgi:hypothetical protein